MPAKVQSLVRLTVLTRCFGLQSKNLSDRKVSSQTRSGVKQYSLDEVVEKCSDLISANLKPDTETLTGRSIGQLKADEQFEKVRKIRMDNDIREGSLVDVDEMKIAFGRKITAMNDILNGIPTRVKMESPDVSQSVLEVVQRCVTEVRNKAASHKLQEVVQHGDG